MSKMAWLDKAVDDLMFYVVSLLALVLVIVGLVSILMLTADVSGLTGTVEDVVVAHGKYGKSSYLIVTVDDVDYRYYGDVAPEEGDEIIFTEDGAMTFCLPIMVDWHLAD